MAMAGKYFELGVHCGRRGVSQKARSRLVHAVEQGGAPTVYLVCCFVPVSMEYSSTSSFSSSSISSQQHLRQWED